MKKFILFVVDFFSQSPVLSESLAYLIHKIPINRVKYPPVLQFHNITYASINLKYRLLSLP